MKKKPFYVSPASEVVELKTSGVLCGSGTDGNFYDPDDYVKGSSDPFSN